MLSGPAAHYIDIIGHDVRAPPATPDFHVEAWGIASVFLNDLRSGRVEGLATSGICAVDVQVRAGTGGRAGSPMVPEIHPKNGNTGERIMENIDGTFGARILRAPLILFDGFPGFSYSRKISCRQC